MQTPRATPWATMWCVHKDESVHMCEKNALWRCSVHTHTVGYSGSLSTVNETNCNKKERSEQNKKMWAHFQLHSVCVPPRGTCRWRPIFPSCVSVNSSAGEVVFGENFLSSLYSSLLTWMDGFFNWFSWFVVWAILHQDSGSVIRSKLHGPIFARFVQSKMPLSFVSSPFPLEWVLYVWSSFASLSHSTNFCSDHPIASCDSRWTGCLRNRSWIPIKCSPWESTFLQHLFFKKMWWDKEHRSDNGLWKRTGHARHASVSLGQTRHQVTW